MIPGPNQSWVEEGSTVVRSPFQLQISYHYQFIIFNTYKMFRTESVHMFMIYHKMESHKKRFNRNWTIQQEVLEIMLYTSFKCFNVYCKASRSLTITHLMFHLCPSYHQYTLLCQICLIYICFNYTQHHMIGWLWIMNWRGCGRKQSQHALGYYPSICLEGPRRTISNLSQDSWCSGQDLNQAGSEELEALSLEPTCSVRPTYIQRFVWSPCE
jgi:hypothetical protein